MDKFDYDSIHKSIQEIIELQNKSSLETDRKIVETNKGIDKLKELYGGMRNNFELQNRSNLETDRKIAETNKGLDKLKELYGDMRNNFELQNKSSLETDRKIAETNKGLDKLKELYGGMSNNLGLSIEEEFFRSFEKNMRLGDIEFHSILRNSYVRVHGITDEFDLVLINSDLVLIVEVKLKYHPNDVKKVLKKISNFKKIYPQYKDYNINGAIAGKILPQQTIEEAKKYNLFVVAQEGADIRLISAPKKNEQLDCAYA